MSPRIHNGPAGAGMSIPITARIHAVCPISVIQVERRVNSMVNLYMYSSTRPGSTCGQMQYQKVRVQAPRLSLPGVSLIFNPPDISQWVLIYNANYAQNQASYKLYIRLLDLNYAVKIMHFLPSFDMDYHAKSQMNESLTLISLIMPCQNWGFLRRGLRWYMNYDPNQMSPQSHANGIHSLGIRSLRILCLLRYAQAYL